MRQFFKDTITVERLTNVYGDADQETYATFGTTKGMVLAVSPNDAFLSDGNLSQSSSMICDTDLTLHRTDRVTINGERYVVRGVKITQSNFGIRLQRAVIESLNS